MLSRSGGPLQSPVPVGISFLLVNSVRLRRLREGRRIQWNGTSYAPFWKNIPGEYIGIGRFSKDFMPEFMEKLDGMIRTQQHSVWWENILYEMVGKRPVYVEEMDGLFWAGYCSFSSFIVPYLQNIGFSENAASAVMTAIATVSFLVQPLTGRLCDTRFSQKQVYLTLSACAIPLLILLPLAAGSVPLTLLIIFGLTLAVYQVPGLVDSWILRIKKEYLALNYGIPRGTGSIFVVTCDSGIM